VVSLVPTISRTIRQCQRESGHALAVVIAFGAEHSSLEGVISEAIVDEDFVLSPDPVPEEVLFVRSEMILFGCSRVA